MKFTEIGIESSERQRMEHLMQQNCRISMEQNKWHSSNPTDIVNKDCYVNVSFGVIATSIFFKKSSKRNAFKHALEKRGSHLLFLNCYLEASCSFKWLVGPLKGSIPFALILDKYSDQ